jgi:nucleoid-associated protein YgaU
MSTKVKVGIAAVIVSALAALIWLDQRTSRREDDSSATPPPSDLLMAPAMSPRPAAETVTRPPAEAADDIPNIFDVAQQPFRNPAGNPAARPPETPIRGAEPVEPGKVIPPPTAGDEYVIREGDTFETIAKERYGDRRLWKLIADANPTVKERTLRPGKKVVIPQKPEPGTEPLSPALTDGPAAPLPSPTAPRVYEVQPGDTLTGISKKLFNTTRHHMRIFEANRDKLNDPNELSVGMKLSIPETPPASAGVVETAAPAGAPDLTGKLVYKVESGDKLWNIAEKHAGDRGILEVINAIVRANPDKLQTASTLLRIGWTLVIPE